MAPPIAQAAQVAPQVATPAARLARVRVAPERVIRTIVGLRLFRPSGFVVRGEKLDDKTVIHNYGHGGAGITLSWGTAQLALTEAETVETRECAVIGCGVVGLSTARMLQEAKQLTRDENPFDAPYAYRRYSMLIEPAIYLNALMRDFYVAGGRIAVREFAEARDLMSLHESLIFNCTGLGARALFHDDELIPIRGQLSFLLPQPEVDYMTSGPGDIYMFPRRDGILLGGTHERGESRLEADPAAEQRILRENGALFAGMR